MSNLQLYSGRSGVDWALQDCCSRGQWITFGIIAGWIVLVLIFWHVRIFGVDILLPFKLLTIFLHEFCHATATWLTCGKVSAIEVYTNEGGVTKSRGGVDWVILPAGYIGSCLWGMFFTLMAVINVWTARIGAGILCLFIVVTLVVYGRKCALILTLIFFLLLIIGLWVITEIFKTVWPLRVIMLLIGVLNGLYAMWDIWDDTIRRKVPESDAYKCATITHCSARLCGVLWFLFSLFFVVFTFYLVFAIREVGNESF